MNINLIILLIIIAATYMILKIFTLHRCPKCQSRYINRKRDEEKNDGFKKYVCSACGAEITRKKIFKRVKNKDNIS